MTHDERLLDLYLDGALDTERHREVAEHLSGCLHCTEYVNRGTALRNAVRAQLRSVQTPDDLMDTLRATLASAALPPAPAERASHRTRALLPAAAMLTLLAIGALLLLQILDRQNPSALDVTTELATTYVTFAHDTSLLQISGDRSTVRSWLEERVGFPVSIPDVPGYELSGGRVVTFDGQAAAMLVYENEPAQTYVSILTFSLPAGELSNMDRSGAFWVGTTRKIAVAVWSDGDLAHALVGAATQDEVVRLASAASRST